MRIRPTTTFEFNDAGASYELPSRPWIARYAG